MAAAKKTFIEDQGRYSIVRKDSIIYRGQTDAFDIEGDDVAILRRNVIKPGQHTYFGLQPEQTTENYGITTDLRVTEDIRLLNINNVEAYLWLQSLMESIDDEAADALLASFPFDDENNVVKRDSDKANDLKVLSFICEHTEYEGYIQPRMPTTTSGMMHAEMAVCSRSGITKIMQPIGQRAIPPPAGRTYSGIMDDYRLRIHGEAMKARMKERKRRIASPESSPVPLGTRRFLDLFAAKKL
jgi:hypothetical protein